MNKVSKTEVRKLAALAKELGVSVRMEVDGTITVAPSDKAASVKEAA